MKHTQVKITQGRHKGSVLTFERRHNCVWIRNSKSDRVIRIKKSPQTIKFEDGTTSRSNKLTAFVGEQLLLGSKGYWVSDGVCATGHSPESAYINTQGIVW